MANTDQDGEDGNISEDASGGNGGTTSTSIWKGDVTVTN